MEYGGTGLMGPAPEGILSDIPFSLRGACLFAKNESLSRRLDRFLASHSLGNAPRAQRLVGLLLRFPRRPRKRRYGRERKKSLGMRFSAFASVRFMTKSNRIGW